MKKLVTILVSFCSILTSFSARAADAKSIVQNELQQIVEKSDMRENILSTNRIIQLGDSAVDSLVDVLINQKINLKAKWAAAQALGEIGNQNALPALESCQSADNGWLRLICANSTAVISGQKKREGKVYLYSIGYQTTRTDVEAGTTEVISHPK